VTNALFICSRNKRRSPTAEKVFAEWPGVETDSAGLSSDAELVLTPDQLAWADIVFVMEKGHRAKLAKEFGAYLKDKRVVCLDIPDTFALMHPELVRRLEARVRPFLRR
jgi:predicted protein tyrosine phosphatase